MFIIFEIIIITLIIIAVVSLVNESILRKSKKVISALYQWSKRSLNFGWNFISWEDLIIF